TMRAHELEGRVRDTISRYSMFAKSTGESDNLCGGLEPGQRVILGVSGGPDSVALLSLLHDLNKQAGWDIKLHVAHLNHMLRGEESEEDERFVCALAGSYNLEFTVKRVDVHEVASQEKRSLEEAARKVRYGFFEELAQETSAGVVAVGHTADDNAETILHRLIRGTGLVGLGGIRPLRSLSPGSEAKLVRPLLYVWRKEIMSYLKEKGLGYRIDSSNLLKDKFRNSLRLELIPLLEQKYNPRIREVLARLGDIAGRSYDFLQTRTSRIVEANLKQLEGETHSLEADILKEHPPFFQHLVLREACERLGIPLKKMNYGHFDEIVSMVEGRIVPRSLELPGKWVVNLEGDRLYFRKLLSHPSPTSLEPVELIIPGITRFPKGVEIRAEVLPMEDGFLEGFRRTKTREEEAFDLDRVGGHLYVRTRRDGDRFWPLGAKGREKLKDFFINQKVPRWKRDSIPIVTTKEHPIWVVGMRIDERVKITPETKRVLKLSLIM
ncbi:MAG: tRNA lysidine(34) synthetase TilS, partial [Candidatus Brocadiales bacterium]|nr:tRNA lysidine(34) synthetase TilS [Candidatus Brocadiales bacterium]